MTVRLELALICCSVASPGIFGEFGVLWRVSFNLDDEIRGKCCHLLESIGLRWATNGLTLNEVQLDRGRGMLTGKGTASAVQKWKRVVAI